MGAKIPPRRTGTFLSGSSAAAVADGSLPGAGRLFGLSDDGIEVLEIEVSAITTSRHQSRQYFDPQRIEELATSIAANGLLQPIGVRRLEAGAGEGGAVWELVFGERRLRAFRHLGRTTIPAIRTRGDTAVLAVIENLQREDLDPFESSDGFASLMADKQCSQRELARLVGKPESTISRLLGLAELDPAIRDDYQQGNRHVTQSALLLIADAPRPEQWALWESAKAGDTIRDLRARRSVGTAGGGAGEGETPVPTSSAGGFTLAQRLHRAVTTTRKHLEALRHQPRAIGDDERQQLAALRDTLDAILGATFEVE